MDVPRDRLAALLTPTWGTFAIASAATLAIIYAEWRTWTVTHGHPDKFTAYYYYWPWYTYTHTDAITGPSSTGVTWNVFTGVAILYLPAAVADRLLKRAAALVPAPDRVERLADQLAMRPNRALWTLGFALVVGGIPVVGFLLYLLPGLVPIALLEAAHPGNLRDVLPSEYLFAVTVPTGYVIWYGLFTAGTRTVDTVREYRG